MSEEKHRFSVRGKYFCIDPGAGYGYWWHKYGIGGGSLWVNEGALVDYDGDFELPPYVRDDLLGLGFLMNEKGVE